jgi:hypothetical protein
VRVIEMFLRSVYPTVARTRVQDTRRVCNTQTRPSVVECVR